MKALLSLLALGVGSSCAAPTPPLAPATPPGTPRVLAPDVISGPTRDWAPAFTPDGATIYFTRDDTILVSHRHGETWSQPEIAPFAGRWADWEPTIAPDGSFMIFASNRPAVEPGVALDGAWGFPKRRTFPGHGSNLWRMDRRGDGWGPPVRLPDTVNRGTAVWEPWIVADGSLYFMDAHLPGRFRLYRSQLAGGVYQEPVPLPFNDGSWADVDTTVAPDESFLVVASNRPPADEKSHDLFLVFRNADGGWGDFVHLPAPINDGESNATNPRLGPDHRTLYFTTDRRTKPSYPRTAADTATQLRRASAWDNGIENIWQVDLSPWLDHRDVK